MHLLTQKITFVKDISEILYSKAELKLLKRYDLGIGKGPCLHITNDSMIFLTQGNHPVYLCPYRYNLLPAPLNRHDHYV